ncbi:hypothetical protein CW304_32475 [Bacillus sp. UFRGS-B20]|nr:hypothetical protein CW304_32475 [Bacillus sp. UFRGS-B20]
MNKKFLSSFFIFRSLVLDEQKSFAFFKNFINAFHVGKRDQKMNFLILLLHSKYEPDLLAR